MTRWCLQVMRNLLMHRRPPTLRFFLDTDLSTVDNVIVRLRTRLRDEF